MFTVTSWYISCLCPSSCEWKWNYSPIKTLLTCFYWNSFFVFYVLLVLRKCLEQEMFTVTNCGTNKWVPVLIKLWLVMLCIAYFHNAEKKLYFLSAFRTNVSIVVVGSQRANWHPQCLGTRFPVKYAGLLWNLSVLEQYKPYFGFQ